MGAHTSGPPGEPVYRGNMGEVYGEQSSREIAIGDTNEHQCVDLVRAEFLWRVSVFGPVLARLVYGTLQTREIRDLRTPLVMGVPGQCAIYVRALNPEAGARYSVTATKATGGARSVARRPLSGPNADFHPDAAFYTAITASSVTTGGLTATVPANITIPVVAGAVLVSGTGFEEFEP